MRSTTEANAIDQAPAITDEWLMLPYRQEVIDTHQNKVALLIVVWLMLHRIFLDWIGTSDIQVRHYRKTTTTDYRLCR